MNKYKEALCSITFTLHQRVTPKKLGRCEDINLDILQELVDKATPKKPIKLDKGWYRIGGEWRERIVDCCPHCTQELRYKRCCDDNECRQAIDWSANED